MKLLLLLVLALAAVWYFARRHRAHVPDASSKGKSHRDVKPAEMDTMVACAVCGVHLPARDAVAGPGANYCSQHHRDQAQP